MGDFPWTTRFRVLAKRPSRHIIWYSERHEATKETTAYTMCSHDIGPDHTPPDPAAHAAMLLGWDGRQ